jgi:hydrogenase maturation protease
VRSTPAPATEPDTVATFVGGVGELFQGDLDVGRRVVDRLLEDGALGPGVAVEDLHYGAVAVVQRLEDLDPDTVILVGAAARDRPPGTVEVRRVELPDLPPEIRQQAVGDAVTGYIGLDLLVEVFAAIATSAPRIVAVELEPVSVGPGAELSPEAETAVPRLVEQVRAEMRRAPLLALAARLRALLDDGRLADAPARDSLRALLDALGGYETDGHWGRTFSLRDQLRLRIGSGEVPEGMDHRDWALWWALIEELDRSETAEVRRIQPGS